MSVTALPNPYRGVHWFRHTPVPLTTPQAVAYATIEESFSHRACFVCGAYCWCRHREPEVEVEIIAARKRREGR